MAVSHNKKFMAVCERSHQAVCFVFELNTLKRRRVITSTESVAKEFIDVKFAYSDEKLTNFLFTLVSANHSELVTEFWSNSSRVFSNSRLETPSTASCSGCGTSSALWRS